MTTTVNQQRLRAVVAQFSASLEEYLSECLEDLQGPVGGEKLETQLVLQAVQLAIEDLEADLDTPKFSFDDPPKPRKPTLTLVD